MKKKSKRFKKLFEQKEKNKVESLDKKIDLIKKNVNNKIYRFN